MNSPCGAQTARPATPLWLTNCLLVFSAFVRRKYLFLNSVISTEHPLREYKLRERRNFHKNVSRQTNTKKIKNNMFLIHYTKISTNRLTAKCFTSNIPKVYKIRTNSQNTLKFVYTNLHKSTLLITYTQFYPQFCQHKNRLFACFLPL